MTNSKKITVILLISVFLAFISAVTYIMAFTNDYDLSLGHFSVNSIYAITTYAVFGLSLILGIAVWIVTRRDLTHNSGAFNENILSSITSVLLAIAVLVSLAYEILAESVTTATAFWQVIYASRLLGVLCAASLLINAVIKSRSKTVACAFSFFPPLYFASKVLCDYFNQKVAVNSTPKIILQIVLVLIMLVFTCETGIGLGRGRIYHRYAGILCIAAPISFAAGVAGIVGHFLVLYFPYSLTQSIVLLLASVYCFAAIYNCINLKFVSTDDKYSEFFEIMQKKADERHEAEKSAEDNNSEIV